jgi:hypothetical protein
VLQTGQVEPPGDRQAGLVVGHRQAHRHLTKLLLAELATVLPRHADRVLALLREAGVIDNPVPHRAVPLERRQYLLAHRPQQRRIVPFGLGHHVMQRLVRRLHPGRRDPRRHRLNALALARQQQPGAVGPGRRRPAAVRHRRHDRVQIGGEPLLTAPGPPGPFLLLCHAPYMECPG